MKKYVLTIVLLLSAVLFVSKAEATKPPKFGGVLSQGVRNVRYYISPSASNFTGDIDNAKHNWMYTGWDNPIYMYKQGSNYGTNIDCYGYTDSRSGVGGYVEFFDGSDR